MPSQNRSLKASDCEYKPSQDGTVSDPPESEVDDALSSILAELDGYTSAQGLLQALAEDGKLAQISPGKVEDLTPASVRQLISVLGCCYPEDDDPMPELPNVEDWEAEDITQYANVLRMNIAENTRAENWYDNHSDYHTESNLDSCIASAQADEKWTDQSRERNISRLNTNGQCESFRQVSIAAPIIAKRMFEEVKNRTRVLTREDPLQKDQVLSACQGLARTIKEYNGSFRTFDQNSLKSLTAKAVELRNAVNKHGLSANDIAQYSLLTSGKQNYRNIPLRDSFFYRANETRMIRSLRQDPHEDVLNGWQSDNQSDDTIEALEAEEVKDRKEVIDSATTKFGIRKDQMMLPKTRQQANKLLTEQLEKLDYEPSRKRDCFKRVEDLIDNSCGLFSDAKHEFQKWKTEYMKTHGINEETFEDHVRTHSERKSSHTEGEAEKALNLRRKYGQFQHGIEDYTQFRDDTLCELTRTIGGAISRIEVSKCSRKHLESTMYKPFQCIAEADRLRLEASSMSPDEAREVEYSQKKKEYSIRAKRKLKQAEELFEPFKNTPLNDLKSWSDVVRSSKEEKEEYNKILDTLEPDWKPTAAERSWVKEDEEYQAWEDKMKRGNFTWAQLARGWGN